MYFGHRCTDMGILPDNSKLHAVMQYPKPVDGDGTMRFVAFANYYRRFIKNFAELTQPLNKLTRKNTKFEWTKECENAFITLKNNLIKPPILAYPNFTQPFRITVDASKVACGAVLSQLIGEEDHPIAFASKSFTKGESNKATISL